MQCKDAIAEVTKWLVNGGITNYTISGSYIDFAANTDTVNQLLNATYTYYTNNAGDSKLRTPSYALPDSLSQYIALIDPGIYFGVPKPAKSRQHQHVAVPMERETHQYPRGKSTKRVSEVCSTGITPNCFKEMYNISGYHPNPHSGSKVGFSSFDNQSASESDQSRYEWLYLGASKAFDVTTVAGGVNNQNPSYLEEQEASMDGQLIMAIAYPLPMQEFITGGQPPIIPNIDLSAADNSNEPYLPYYRYLLDQKNSDLPQVISSSYGDEESTVPYAYASYVCNLIGLMGARGITVLVSSGDTGVGSGCKAPDGTTQFNAQFPATCPFVTSVGGTTGLEPVYAWPGSSGGFSSYFPRPAWQDAAVKEYLGTGISQETRNYYESYTNFSGRAFPDVAAHSGTPGSTVCYGGLIDTQGGGGTSAAAPVWAGIVALLNDARLRANQSSFGFLNPLLYKLPAGVLTDITSGGAGGCNGVNYQNEEKEPSGSGIVPWAAWNATVGWDPVTGLGTPNFGKLREKLIRAVGL